MLVRNQGNHERVLRIRLWSEIAQPHQATPPPSSLLPPPWLWFGTIWYVINFWVCGWIESPWSVWPFKWNETPLAVLSHDSTICFSAFQFPTRYFCKFVFCRFNIRSVWYYTWPAARAAACWEETKDTKGAVKVNQIHFTRRVKAFKNAMQWRLDNPISLWPCTVQWPPE